jgi:DNA-binding MarR family transcriptional regulator
MGDGFTASHRGVLESLATHGPQTVPALARSRPVARQHIQVLVNDLVAMGLVETRPNPAHKRSSLVDVTTGGRRRFDAIRRAESRALKSIQLSVTATQMREIAVVLQEVSGDLSRWLSEQADAEWGRPSAALPSEPIDGAWAVAVDDAGDAVALLLALDGACDVADAPVADVLQPRGLVHEAKQERGTLIARGSAKLIALVLASLQA